MSSLSADFPKLTIDQSAETVAELMASWPYSERSLFVFTKKMVNEGKWERVSKRVGKTIKPAYRRTRK